MFGIVRNAWIDEVRARARRERLFGGQLLARGALSRALSTQLASDQSPSAAAQIGVSFRARGGTYCRTFALRDAHSQDRTLAGLACHERDTWQIEVLTPREAARPVRIEWPQGRRRRRFYRPSRTGSRAIRSTHAARPQRASMDGSRESTRTAHEAFACLHPELRRASCPSPHHPGSLVKTQRRSLCQVQRGRAGWFGKRPAYWHLLYF
jgi:hypothetical protein